MPVGKYSKDGTVHQFRWWCPGCESIHTVPVDVPGPHATSWGFNGSEDSPTLTPSVLVYERHRTDGSLYSPRCHTFIRNGQIEFLGDCTHALAGQTVPMTDLSTL